MSLCAPSRVCHLSGLYPPKNGITGNQTRWDPSVPVLPGLLHEAGWRTAHIGKWQMDGDDRVQPGYGYWAAQAGQGQYENPRKNINGTWTELKGYDTTIITNQAAGFIRDSRKRGLPFCAWIGYKACHGPFTPAPGHENDLASVEFKPDRARRRSPYRAAQAGAPAGRKAKRKAAKTKAGDPPATLERWAARERDHYRCLMGAEDSAGRLPASFEELKALDDTAVVLAGDNGFSHGEHGLHGEMEAYQEALRIPIMARFPRLIRAGRRCSSFVARVDFASAIPDFRGAKPARPMQGRSWKPLVTGAAPPQPWCDSFVYSQYGERAEAPVAKALRTERYKLILNLNPKDREELYDLKTGPREMKKIDDPAVPAVQATL